MKNRRRLLMLLALLFAFGQQLHAQIKVDMRVDRRMFMVYEPIMVVVGITNLTGHDLTLRDVDNQKWFSFQVKTGDGRIIPPLDLDYKLSGIVIPAGKTVKRSLNLTPLYAVQEFGLYRIRASVYTSESQSYTSSAWDEFQVSDGKLFWEETVGIPDELRVPKEGIHRTISLLTFRMPTQNMLYVRVQDKDLGRVYTTSPLGRLLTSNDPEVKLDKHNMLHVLQMVAARTYVYSRVGLNGEWHDQVTYNAINSRPSLKTDTDGEVYVKGGQPDVPVVSGSNAPEGPKISDRPPGFPQL